MLLFTVKTRDLLVGFKKELKEIKILDSLMLDYDYTFYNDIRQKRIDSLIEKVIDKDTLLENILRYEFDMYIHEYNELKDYEKEVVLNEIDRIIDDAILELVE